MKNASTHNKTKEEEKNSYIFLHHRYVDEDAVSHPYNI